MKSGLRSPQLEKALALAQKQRPNTAINKFKKKKPQWDIASHLSVQLSSKRPEITNVGKDVEETEPLYTAGENVNWCRNYENQYGVSLKN